MKINQRLLVCTLALCIVPGLYAAENDDAGNVPSAASTDTPATLARTEIELLRSQIALQQQQIEILRSSLEKQQRQIEMLAGAEPQNPQIASLALPWMRG